MPFKSHNVKTFSFPYCFFFSLNNSEDSDDDEILFNDERKKKELTSVMGYL